MVLLDEPFFDMQPSVKSEMIAFIRSWALNRFVIITTSDTQVAEEMADHLAIIYKGDLVFIDSKEKIDQWLSTTEETKED